MVLLPRLSRHGGSFRGWYLTTLEIVVAEKDSKPRLDGRRNTIELGKGKRAIYRSYEQTPMSLTRSFVNRVMDPPQASRPLPSDL
jgi:hypothetical protein